MKEIASVAYLVQYTSFMSRNDAKKDKMIVKEWIIYKNPKTQAKSQKQLSLVEKLLAARGLVKDDEIKDFLNPLEIQTTHPKAFTDMPKAVERVAKAIDGEENILIYGDFDADGVTSTALLLRALTHLGAKVDHFIPEREKEGHGLNTKALVKLMTVKKPKLIITVDCGVSDVEQVQFVNSFKIDVIITDHHEAPEILPPALAIINPKAPNALDEKLSTKEIQYLTSLAGVGVAFKLAQAVLEHYKKLDFVYALLPYVAVGTIADIVPLIGENRYFVAKGLELISNGKHHGLKRLLEVAGYSLELGITSEQIAFGVAPRINASGRLDTVEDALKVLVSDNNQEIEMSIISLNNFNKVRQELCENVFLEADDMLQREASQGINDKSIILFNPKWHIGIIGIVASKLVEKYHKPTLLMTFSEETKQIRCSARSVEGVNLYDVISANSGLLDGFGGHAMAAGLSFGTEKVSFEEVKKGLNKTIEEVLENQELTPILNVDLVLEPNEVDANLISDIERLQPFGAANPNPVFVLNNLTLLQKKLIGSNRNHLKLVVEDSQHNTYDCLWWSRGDISLINGDKLDIAFCPQLNTFNGNTTLQFILKDIHADNLIDLEEPSELQYQQGQSGQPGSQSQQGKSNGSLSIKVYDHRKKSDIFSSVEDYVKTSNLNIAVFAEDKVVLEKLKPYKTLSERTFGRKTAKKTDVIMFFDYPASEEIFDEVIKKSSPEFLHFMHYELTKLDEQEFLTTFSKMIKFAHNNKSGVFDLEKSASFLAQPTKIVVALLELFEESEMIKILNKTETEYKIEFRSNTELSKTLHSTGYKQYLELIEETREYKTILMENELSNLI